MKVRDVWQWIDERAPFDSAESFDNVGLMMGDLDAPCQTILFALDATEDVADEALRLGAGLIVTHHPFIFHGIKSIDYTGPQGRVLCKLAQSRISVLSAHTNWDKAPGGVSDALAEALGLQNVERCDDFLRLGQLSKAVSAEEFARIVQDNLYIRPRVFAPKDKLIQRVAVAGGAYGEAEELAATLGADAFVVGEIRHHEVLDACARGLAVYDAGHFHTELPGMRALYERLSADARLNGWPVQTHLHCNAPYPGEFLAL